MSATDPAAGDLASPVLPLVLGYLMLPARGATFGIPVARLPDGTGELLARFSAPDGGDIPQHAVRTRVIRRDEKFVTCEPLEDVVLVGTGLDDRYRWESAPRPCRMLRRTRSAISATAS